MKVEKINLNSLRDMAYKIACNHGFHDKELSNEHFLMLVITELSEVVEADRENRRADIKKYTTSIECGNPDKAAFVFYIKDTVEDELADVAIRLLDLAGLRKINLDLLELPIQKSCISDIMTIFCFDAISFIYMGNIELKDKICVLISLLFEKAQSDKFNLLWHIEQKMKYNNLRQKMHGKKY